jgi:hypothetical protein
MSVTRQLICGYAFILACQEVIKEYYADGALKHVTIERARNQLTVSIVLAKTEKLYCHRHAAKN